MKIVVCSLDLAQSLVHETGAASVVSLLGPESPHRAFNGIDGDRHLKLTFHDITTPMPGLIAPLPEHTERIIGFVKGWDRRMPMIIHCFAGISRSTAAAYTAMCLLDPKADEFDLAWRLREASPIATPNRLIVSHADKLLGRNGRMSAAIDDIGRGEEAFEGVPFSLAI
jgi:predicted protein tyrosine phosphatase